MKIETPGIYEMRNGDPARIALVQDAVAHGFWCGVYNGGKAVWWSSSWEVADGKRCHAGDAEHGIVKLIKQWEET